MIDYRLLNMRLLADIAADVKLTPAELDRLQRATRARRILRHQIAKASRVAREDSNVIPFRRSSST